MLTPTEEQESLCGFCPVKQSAEFCEAMYRAGFADLDELFEYCKRLRQFKSIGGGLSPENREALARLLNIPAHHCRNKETN